MFASEVTDQRLDGFEKEFGWRPTPHSTEEVDKWKERLRPVFVTEKNSVFQERDLTAKEHRFIANERAMCAASCYYFLTRYYYIKSKNKIHRFTFRQGQWILWQMICELDRMGVSKCLQILKARQLGISTLCEGIARWISLFIPGVAAQVGSSDGQKTQIMLGMMLLASEMLPPWLTPTETRAKTKSDRAMMEYSKIGSLIMVQPGSMRGGMGQGTTPTFVHLSELSQFTNPTTQLDEGLFKSLHESPELVVLLESTGDATHPSAWWWREQWIANREGYWSGKAKFLPVFLPWHTTPELYPGPEWIKKFPVPEGWQPNADTLSHVRRAEAYVRSTPMLSKVIGDEWTMPWDQQWFWEFNHEDHKRRRVEKSWYRQMPSDDFEALMGENDKVYSEESAAIMDSSIAKMVDTQVYMVVGDGIEDRREPKEGIWYGEDAPPRQKCSWMSPKGDKMHWMFVPMEPARDEKEFDPLGKVLIWELPREGFDYSMGVDTGTGVGGDRSVITVTRHGSDEFPDEEVAEYASDDIPTAEIHAWIAALAALYSRHMPQSHPKIAIEMIRKFGDLSYHQTRLMGFRRWHEWGQGFDRKTFTEKVGKRGRIGWYTNAWSRPLLLSAFQYAVENGWYLVRSKWLAEELKELEQKTTDSGKTRVDHASGKHNDRVFSAAMSYFTLHQRDVMAERAKKRYDEPDDLGLIIQTGPVGMTVQIPERAWNSRSMIIAAREEAASRDRLF